MMLRMKLLSVIPVVFLLVLSSVSLAENPLCTQKQEVTDDNIWNILKDKTDAECYKADVDEYIKAQKLDGSVKNDDERRDRVVLSWKMLKERADALGGDSAAVLSEQITSIGQRAQAAAAIVSEAKAADVAQGAPGASAWNILWGPGILPTSGSNTNDLLHLKEKFIESCKKEMQASEGSNKKQCPLTFKTSEGLVKLILMGNRIGIVYGNRLITALAKDVSKVNDDWDKFLFESKPMYPLDLVTTDLFYRWFGEYDKSEEGLKMPPNYQWFFLHPSPAFEYVSGAEDGEQLKPSIYLEVIGVNAWRNNYITGASVIVSYTDRKNLDDLGYGLLLTYKNTYSLAVTRYDDETGVMFSLDVAQFYKESLKPTLDSIR
jgi:hypothetical protein